MKIYADIRTKRKPVMTEEKLIDLAELFKIFGDSTRIRILYTLLQARLEGELCVNEIAKALEMTQSAISHQLRILKSNKLVRSRREGKTIYYALSDSHVESILYQGMEHVAE